eukprot:TRINITY_DN3854_c1_g1_i1.p2 TRINITY_DN3854_c1_g1~~TRINITY_DN3854_c1_g1_i1.p2  ORF type:complete len:434 (+),score=55.52 TRINITY_DN3854_c1_g1_i1:203-1504(+)
MNGSMIDLRNIVASLSSNDDRQQLNALVTIRNLVVNYQVAEIILSNVNTVAHLLKFLQSNELPHNQLVADSISEALQNSGNGYRQALLNIIHAGGVAVIVTVLQNNSSACKPITISLIKEMTWGADQKSVQYVASICWEMYNAGIVPLLVQALSIADGLDNKSKIRIMKTLGTFATHCGEQVVHGGAIGAVLDYLYDGDLEGQLAAVEALSVFTSVSAVEVLSCGAVSPLIRLLRSHVEVQKKVLQVLLMLCENGDAHILQRTTCEPIQEYIIICSDPDARMLAAKYLSGLTRQCRRKILRKELVPIVMAILDGSYNPKLSNSNSSPRSLEEASMVTQSTNVCLTSVVNRPLMHQGSGTSIHSEAAASVVLNSPQLPQQKLLQQQAVPGLNIIEQDTCYFSGKDLELEELDLELDIDFDVHDDDAFDNLLEFT